MLVKDAGTIWTTTDTGKTFGYDFLFVDDKLSEVIFVGSHGDLFVEKVEDYAPYITPDTEVTEAFMQQFFNTMVCKIRVEPKGSTKEE